MKPHYYIALAFLALALCRFAYKVHEDHERQARRESWKCWRMYRNDRDCPESARGPEYR